MTSQGYRDWLAAGKPDSGLARPLAKLRDALRAGGYVVYDEPDDRHRLADPPEDHTEFSATGWPGPSPRWWRHAIDVMPTKGGQDLYNLGQYLVRDRTAGLALWIKYVNVPTDATLRSAMHHRWEPSHGTALTDDTGHIHISCVTGVEETDTPPYNPFGYVLPSPDRSWTENLIMNLPTVHAGDNGRSVGRVQGLCNAFGATLKVDFDFGPLTDAAVRRFQSASGLLVDGIVGEHTWTALLTR